MIYQFDYFGRMVASHESYLAAAKWIKTHTYDLPYPAIAAETISFYAGLNDEIQCLRYPAFGFFWSSYSFLGDL